MSDTGGWVYQGRQNHGWFGHGTAPKAAKDGASAGDGSLFGRDGIGQRIDYAARSVIGHVDPKDRGRWERSLGQAGRDQFKTAVAAWYGAAGLSRDEFRARFLDPDTSDETIDRLRSAAAGMVEARTQAALGAAGAALASAVAAIGVQRGRRRHHGRNRPRWKNYRNGVPHQCPTEPEVTAMSGYTSKKFIDDLTILHRAASQFDGWHKDSAETYIYVGEYSLALDSIAYAYLKNGQAMPPDLFAIFEKLAVEMDLESDEEFDAVARLRAAMKSG